MNECLQVIFSMEHTVTIHSSLIDLTSVFLQDKRRVQEDIAKKRRLIEEEKLQLQYIKVLLSKRKDYSFI